MKSVQVPINILLVDDHSPNLIALEAILDSPGYSLITASSGNEALKQVLDHDFAVILLDVQMPELDGFETAYLIKQRDKSKHTPIIFLTALSRNEEQIFKGYSAGAVDYVLKPFNPNILRAKVSVFVDLYTKNWQLWQERLARTEAEAARAEAEAARNDLSFLVEAGTLLASSLDDQKTLESIARLAVPKFADWCVVDLIEEGKLRRFAMSHTDPSKEAIARALQRRYPSSLENPFGIPKVLKTGSPEIYPEILDSIVRTTFQDEEYWQVLRRIGLTSAMIVPLKVQNRILGVMTFVCGESGRVYGKRDLSMAQELAFRATLAVDNARLYSEAQEASMIKSQFISNVSHELRTPLNAIIGYNSLILDGTYGPLPEYLKDPLEGVQRNADDLLLLVNDVLDLAKIEAGRISVQVKEVNLTSVIESVLSGMRPLLEEKALHIRFMKAEDFPLIHTDPERVKQIIVNLLSNAVKFTDEGEITITTKNLAEQENIEIAVKDTGVGMKPEELSKIFDSFYQVDGSATRKVGGVGLGLAIVKELIKLLDGKIEVESIYQQGSLFSVFLPYHPKKTFQSE
jgi:signal transduction histidine kinase/DNA-binding response OmpR family regulator